VTEKNRVLAAIAAGLFIVVAGILAFRLFRAEPRTGDTRSPERGVVSPAGPAETAPSTEGERRIRATLYFLSSSGNALVPEEREIALAPSLQAQLRLVVEELLRGSRRGLPSPFPPGVVLRDVFASPQGLAYVDLSQELVANHPGGSEFEQLTVYSLSNTLTTNFPAVTRVQILVEGREVETLAGHLDLTIPYGKSLRFLEGAATPSRSRS